MPNASPARHWNRYRPAPTRRLRHGHRTRAWIAAAWPANGASPRPIGAKPCVSAWPSNKTNANLHCGSGLDRDARGVAVIPSRCHRRQACSHRFCGVPQSGICKIICGSGLARDGITAVCLTDRIAGIVGIAGIAGKPAHRFCVACSHRDRVGYTASYSCGAVFR